MRRCRWSGRTGWRRFAGRSTTPASSCMSTELSPTGRALLDRRGFLNRSVGGLAGGAVTHLLSSQSLLRAERSATPIRPVIRPEAPSAARAAHFAPRAKKVLVIFCSGAISHLDTFDYKPELIRRHGEAMPGADKLITFQGQQGMLAAPLYEFRRRGQSGKYASDLLPRLGELVDDMCFVHSMTAKSNTHGPAENQMGTGFTLEGFPAMGAWVSYALGSEAQDLPAFVAIPDPRGVPQTGPAQWSAGFLPAVFQGTAFNAARPIPHLATPAGIAPATDRATRDFARFLNDEHL